MLFLAYGRSCCWLDLSLVTMPSLSFQIYQMLMFSKVPESPRYLVSKGQDEKALEILCKLHHDPADVEDHFAHRELRYIKSQLEVDINLITEHGQWQLFTMPTYRRRSILGFVLMMGGQNIGVLVINNYNTLLYESLGLSNMQALVVGAAYNTWAAFANMGGATVSDRLGRRKALCKSMLPH